MQKREETPGSKEARPPGVFFGHQVFLSPGHQVCLSHEMDFFAKLQIRPRGLKKDMICIDFWYIVTLKKQTDIYLSEK